MPTITINGKVCDFTPGQMILQVANANGIEIPQYCYHDGLSIVASCRICLGEIWAPDARAGGKLAPFMGGKLMPTCQTPAADGMVVHTDTPKSVANQKAVMEYLLINHPIDCAVCDQAGECYLQDYSYQYGRGKSRFEEQKVKNPKKDVGPHVLLYSDRCIMCTRCVRFTKEVSGTSELLITGRGNKEEIDVFPGVPLANELSANVIDLCPVGALLDKDFLFAQRVWFLKRTPSIDGLTASGDNIWIEHNEGKVYRIKPRHNPGINKWWITDEVRYGWHFVHDAARLGAPRRREFGALTPCTFEQAYADLVDAAKRALAGARRAAAVISPMLSCEEAYLLGTLARGIDPHAHLFVGPVPTQGEDKVFPPGKGATDPKAFVMSAEKAPNARGVRRVLGALGGHGSTGTQPPAEFGALRQRLDAGDIGLLVITGNYPSTWATPDFIQVVRSARARGTFVIVIDTLDSPLADESDVLLPGATWAEKSGTFENRTGVLQAFEQAIPEAEGCRAEGQIVLDLMVRLGLTEPDTEGVREYRIIDEGPGQVPQAREVRLERTRRFCAASVRSDMATTCPQALAAFTPGAGSVQFPAGAPQREGDMAVVEL
ncbi:MAG: (2Fe-2S)-binding protein [Phycisphaerales bacterium]|nr:(2Fe-2S)-binding protein [Phycisphaerales bacterium]